MDNSENATAGTVASQRSEVAQQLIERLQKRRPLTTASPQKLTLPDMVRKAKADAVCAEKQAANRNEQEFAALFGRIFPDSLPLMIPCIVGTKKPMVRCGRLKGGKRVLEDEYYLKKLKQAIIEGGNIAIKLGPDSANLCVIDFDDDALIEPFVKANPQFEHTLRTRGSKGCSFWFYAEDPGYIKEVRRIVVNGNESGTGEWRGGKGLSTFWGVHPKGMAYERINDVPPIQISTRKIVWPEGWELSKTASKLEPEPGPLFARS
jgi:hypothetical protein